MAAYDEDIGSLLNKLCELDNETKECLLRSDFCKHITDDLVATYGCPRWAAVWSIKLIVPAVFSISGMMLGDFAKERLLRRLAGVWIIRPVLERLTTTLTDKVREWRTEDKIKELVKGNITVSEALKEEYLKADAQLAFMTLHELSGIRDELSGLRSQLHPQPFLDSQVIEHSQAKPYSFRSRQVSLLGRGIELGRLMEFCLGQDNSSLFSWWLIEGQAGSGKSRLAMELCLELNFNQGQAGFLRVSNLKDFKNWSVWQPETRTILVVDDVISASKEMIELIKTLYERTAKNHPNQLENPVRLIIIEREANGEWFEMLNRDDYARSTRYLPGEGWIKLQPLDQGYLFKIIEELHLKHGMPSPPKEATLTDLQKIDPAGYPLYSIIAGYAMINGENIRDWNRSNVLDYLLGDEMATWQRLASDFHVDNRTFKMHLNLLALVTLCGGLDKDNIRRILNKNYEFLPSLKADHVTPLNTQFYRSIAGMSDGYYYPLSPDIVGEFFLLNNYLEKEELEYESVIAAMVHEAWISGEYDIEVRMGRFFTDFSDYPGKDKLFVDLPGTDNPISLKSWSKFGAQLIKWYGQHDRPDRSSAIYEQLKVLVKQHVWTGEKDYSWTRVYQAEGALLLLEIYEREGKTEEALKLYDEIEAIASYHPTGGLLVSAVKTQASAACRLLHHYGVRGDYDAAELMYKEIRSIRAGIKFKFPELAEIEAECAFGLCMYAAAAEKQLDAENWYEKGIELDGVFEDEIFRMLFARTKHMLECRVKAAYSLVVHFYNSFVQGKTIIESAGVRFIDHKGTSMAMKYNKEIEDIARKHSLSSIVIYWAKSASYMSIMLSRFIPDDAQIHLQQALIILKSCYRSGIMRNEVMEGLEFLAHYHHDEEWFRNYLKDLGSGN